MSTEPKDEEGAREDRTARVPKYYRLKEHVVRLTESQAPDTPVPPERALAAAFGTSRTTVRQALRELVVEGRLRRVQGKGTFVARPKVSQTLGLTSSTDDMRAQGREPAVRLLTAEHVAADERLAALLDLPPGGRVLRVERLRSVDGEPMAVEVTHLGAERFPSLRDELARGASLYTALREVHGVRLTDAEETIETAPASPREAGLLGTDVGLPMLSLSRHSFDERGRAVEWTRSVYRGDRYRLVARLRVPTPEPSRPKSPGGGHRDG
ncbi:MULTISPECIES: GntR family transcriptional regulator [unclassified Streptomyces]|uniref:GntR family transcriptional regulator n=1 Tax=unclassified Streptomyces TaxID=2593676 RepID=UPI001907197B|nr:GntR family transcriptional regulator [Streptomyces sp. HSG2]